MIAKVVNLYRYPVKGLTGEPLEQVILQKDEGIEGDRMVAMARQPGLFNPLAPVAIPKTNFLMLAKDEALARLTTNYDTSSETLTIRSGGEILLSESISSEKGRQSLQRFFKSHLDKKDLSPEVSRADGHKFTDISVVSPAKMRAISLINLASIRALEDATGFKVDPRRFRANVYFDSNEPFIENGWIDQDITIGNSRLKCVMRTKRCPATEVNPESGERDIRVPFELRKHFGHYDMGIYAEIRDTGIVSISDEIQF